jgi:hypothetical protein
MENAWRSSQWLLKAISMVSDLADDPIALLKTMVGWLVGWYVSIYMVSDLADDPIVLLKTMVGWLVGWLVGLSSSEGSVSLSYYICISLILRTIYAVMWYINTFISPFPESRAPAPTSSNRLQPPSLGSP